MGSILILSEQISPIVIFYMMPYQDSEINKQTN